MRTFVRRRDWGDERALARRARAWFGAPKPYQWLTSRGVLVDRMPDASMRGEWLTPASPRAGILLYLHGGGYVSCSPQTHRPVTATLARLLSRRVFSVDYRRAPEHHFPAAVQDCVSAYRTLLDTGHHAHEIAVAGDSAGGGLALALCVQAREEGLPLPACVVVFSPWTDLAGTGASVTSNAERDSLFFPENIGQFASAYLGLASPREPLASPAYADLHGFPPLLLHVGDEEILLDDARAVHEAVLAAGGRSALVVFEGCFHGWQMCAGLVPEADDSLRQAAHFIEASFDGIRKESKE